MSDVLTRYAPEDFVFGDLIEKKAKSNKGKPFLEFDGLDLTYDQFNEMANRTANGFASQGVKRGDKVGLMLSNSPEFLYALFGLAKLGAVSVPINTAYKGDLLEHILKSSDSSALVVEEDWLERVALVEGKLPSLAKVFVRTPNGGPGVPNGLEKPTENFRSLLDSPAKKPDVNVHYSEIQALMYTSGTTGPSKGVQVTQFHGPNTAMGFIRYIELTTDDLIFSPMPLFHGIGLWQGVVGPLLVDGKVVISDRFSASGWWDSIKKHKATIGMSIFSAVPILLAKPPSPEDKNHTMRAFYLGPSKMDEALNERFGVRSVEIYGSTEVGICTGAPYGQIPPGSCGLPREDTYEVKIFDEFDREVSPGEPGEICVRPIVPFSVFTGYYNFAEATVAAWRNLWFHTGDQAYRDKDGYIYFIDRVKDSMRRRGENISSFEVERGINSHPAVLESAAVAVASEIGEDEVKIVVVLQDGAHLEPEELLDHAQERMAYFMVPRFVEFVPALPKTPTEKVEKYKLRLEGNHGITPNTWDRDEAGYKVKR